MPLSRFLTNLAVILGLVATIGSIVAVAILKARTQAARMLCASNQRQIAIAIHNYHNDYSHFPPPTIANPLLTVEKRLSWHADIRAYMESGGPRFDKTVAWDAPANRSPIFMGMDGQFVGNLSHPEKWLLCPSNASANKANEPAFAHYVGITGLGEDAEDLPLDDPRAGCFGHARKVTLQYIQAKDGTSNTMLVAETTWDNGPWLAGVDPLPRSQWAAPRRPWRAIRLRNVSHPGSHG